MSTLAAPHPKRILAPTDFSPAAAPALAWARALCAAFDAELILLHVIDQDITALAAPSIPATPSPEVAIVERVRAEAEGLLSGLAADSPRVRTIIREGVPHSVILDVAAAVDVQLIVMGTHGRTGLLGAAFGNVTAYVTQRSTVPVLTVRHGQP